MQSVLYVPSELLREGRPMLLVDVGGQAHVVSEVVGGDTGVGDILFVVYHPRSTGADYILPEFASFGHLGNRLFRDASHADALEEPNDSSAYVGKAVCYLTLVVPFDHSEEAIGGVVRFALFECIRTVLEIDIQ